MSHIKIGSRESRLAVAQAELLKSALCRANPGCTFEIKTYKTTGDRILDRSLDKIGGKGLFTKELEAALLSGGADLLVHSFKDVPMDVDGRIPIVGVTERGDPRDVLVLPSGELVPDGLRADASRLALRLQSPVGCSSRRRTLQFKALFPKISVAPVRGNVNTRLQKLDGGEYGALILAAAGLKRLGLEGRISAYFEPDKLLPAACQGILALQARSGFDETLIKGVCDPDTFLIAKAERAFVRALDGGCSSPVAAHAVIEGGRLSLTGLFVEDDGETMRFDRACGALCDAEKIGAGLAAAMKERWGKA